METLISFTTGLIIGFTLRGFLDYLIVRVYHASQR